MNVLSLFDGMSCGRIALERSGLTVDNYFASEIDKHAIKVSESNYPDIIRLGDVTKIDASKLPKIDILLGGSPCFTSSNLVMSVNGYVPISELKVGDLVLTHRNRYRKVLRVGSEKKETISIKSQGSTKIVTTKNHPFYCYNDKNKESELSWKDIITFGNNDKVVSIKWGVDIDSKEFSDIDLYILGRFLADGCCYKTKRKNRKDSYTYKFKISIGKHKLEHFKSKVDDRFSYIEEGSVCNAFIYKKEWVEIGEKFGHLAYNKFIPNFILDLPIERLKIFISGYMDGDGHVRKRKSSKIIYKRNTTVSEKLTLTLSLAIQKCYNGVSIYHSIRPNKHNIANRIVNQKNTYEVSFTEDETKFSKYKLIDDYVAYNITKSKSFIDCGINDVYNIEVEEDNSYIVNNLIVHNCQGFSFAGKQLNFEDPRSKLFFEYVRLLKETNPKYFLLENVNMKKDYQDIISNELGVEPIKINSNLVSAQNRNRLYWTNIPNVKQPIDKGIYLIDIIEEVNIERIYVKHIPHGFIKEKTVVQDKYPTLCSQDPSSKHKIYVEHKNNLEFDTLILETIDPNKKYWSEEQMKKYYSNQYVRKDYYRIENLFDKCQCLMAQFGMNHPKVLIKVEDKITFRKITPIECERLQTIPDNYTKSISTNQRYKVLGNGWTVDVICHILKNIS